MTVKSTFMFGMSPGSCSNTQKSPLGEVFP